LATVDTKQIFIKTQNQNLGQELENKQLEADKQLHSNECPVKDEDGNCLVPGTFSDSEPIGGA
jgi:hypothetical protein